MAGRRPKPTEIKRAAGNPGRRPLNDDEPDTGAIPIYPPAHLSPQAAQLWSYIVGLYSSTTVIQLSDSTALERLCEVYAEIRELQDIIEHQGRVFTAVGQNGSTLIKTNPAVSQLQEADKRLRQYLVEFGLTPSSRTRIGVSTGNNNDNGDPLDEFL
ncbi:phage terminase small subunit P27 family [Salinicola sp. V024]|uniref:phage terminase small subunit P27 family n=1 Tax=Salinicola sp. V024 TaxID=3459609 RepID=UPI0040442457